jgi:periplasmic protein CpxP/Spy
MKSIRFRILVAGLAVLLGTAIAHSQSTDTTAPPPPHRMHAYAHRGMGGPMEFLRKLNLTDDQRTQIHAIMQKEHPTMKPLFQQQHSVELQLRQYAEGTFDAAKVQALATQKAQIQAQITVAETQIHNQVFQVLTAEQQSQLKQMEANHEARMQERMQERGNNPPAPPSEQ